MLHRRLHSPWGTLRLSAEAGRLFSITFADPAVPEPAVTPPAQRRPGVAGGDAQMDLGVLEAAERQLLAYADGRLDAFSLPLAALGTAFQARVWSALQRVPRGATVSYGELARMAGSPGGARAVGGAVGANPWVIVVPCHRVLAGQGRLGGFSSGLERKRGLLRHEGVAWRE